MTLTEFLLARIAEDERRAKVVLDVGIHPTLVIDPVAQKWLKDFGPGRVLRECEAKRRIVFISQGWLTRQRQTTDMLCILATVYADHPDYDEAWRM